MGIISTLASLLSPSRRATIENPAYSLDDPEMWDALSGGEAGAAGVRVGPESALKLSPVWRGVFLIANTVGKLPLYVYERNADGEGKHYATKHPAYMLLRRKPNDELTSFTFKQVVTAQAILMGDGYAWIERSGNGAPRQLIPLPPKTCHPVRVNGVLYYVYLPGGNAQPRKLLASDVYHIKGPGLDGLCGIDLTCKAKDSLGSGLAAQTYAASYFANGAEPRVVFETANKLAPDQRKQIAAMWSTMHAGLENVHKSGILEHGVTVKAFGVNPESSQLLETRKFTLMDVANWLQLPLPKIGYDGKTSTYSSLEQESQNYLDDTMEPWLVQHEEQCWDKLLTEEEKRNDSHTIEFMRLALMRADAAARSTFYHNAMQDGWMNADEVRARENLNPIGDGNGKKYYRPLNMVPVGGEEEQKQKDFERQAWLATSAQGVNLTDLAALTAAVGLPAGDGVQEFLPIPDANVPADAGDDEVSAGSATSDRAAALCVATRQVLLDAVGRMVRRIRTHATKASRAEGGMRDFLAGGIDPHRAVIVDTIGPAVTACGAAFGVRADVGLIADAFLADVRRRLLATDGTPAAVEAALTTSIGDNP
jgi:HK97 family phage portal protein